MENRYNLYILEALFSDYLRAGKLTRVTIKNYCSDVRYFLSWLSAYIIPEPEGECTALDGFIAVSDRNSINAFREYLVGNKIPSSTINRRLSSLRTFYTFCTRRGILENSPMETVLNVSRQALNRKINDKISLDYQKKLKTEFLKHLERRKGVDRQDSVVESFLRILDRRK